MDLKNTAEEERHTLSRKLALAQKTRPVVASTVKTKAATRAVLNSMKDDIHELKVSGIKTITASKLRITKKDIITAPSIY